MNTAKRLLALGVFSLAITGPFAQATEAPAPRFIRA